MSDQKGQVKWLKQPNNQEWEAFQKAVGPKYSQVSESIRRVAPGALTCSMFCGGKNCKYDNPAKFKREDMAIVGLYSSWVTEEILAMSRPSSYAVKEYNIIAQFKEQEIKSIINLQHPGEHASCGFGLEPSGFSYVPQDFMDEDVFYYNYGWNDYGVRSLHSILDIVKVMDFAVSDGKVAVHCHAGLGRTGVVIACYLIFRDRLEADDAIHLVRTHRPKAIQTRGQIACVKDFAKYLKPMRTVYCLSSSDDSLVKQFSLDDFLSRQKNLLHGEEERKLRYVPKIIYLICQRLLQIVDIPFCLSTVTSWNRKGMHSMKTSKVPNDSEGSSNEETKANDQIPTILTGSDSLSDTSISVTKESNRNPSPALSQGRELVRSRSQSLCQNLDQLNTSKMSFAKCRSDMNLVGMNRDNALPDIYDSQSFTLSEAASVDMADLVGADDSQSQVDSQDISSRSSGTSTSEPLTEELPLEPNGIEDQERQFGRPGKLEPLTNPKKSRRRKKSKTKSKTSVNVEDSFLESEETTTSCDVTDKDSLFADDVDSKLPSCLNIDDLCKHLCSRSVEPRVLTQVDRYKRKLNASHFAWQKLETESDVRVLGILLWSWLEHLKEPILTKDRLQSLAKNLENAEESLQLLDRNARKTIECLLFTLSKLSPISESSSQKLIRRVAVALTKDKMLSSRLRSDSGEKLVPADNESHLPYSGNGQVCIDFIVKWLKSNESTNS